MQNVVHAALVLGADLNMSKQRHPKHYHCENQSAEKNSEFNVGRFQSYYPPICDPFTRLLRFDTWSIKQACVISMNNWNNFLLPLGQVLGKPAELAA